LGRGKKKGFPSYSIPRCGRKEKGVSILLHPTLRKERKRGFHLTPSRVGRRKEKCASNLLPSLDGRGWGRVILERRVITQKPSLNNNHHIPGILARNKNNFFARG
jgi:hypothetical protein